jgi:regulator of replication initiation timing
MTADNKQFDNAMTDLHNQAASLQNSYSEERDIVNQLLGQAQMADAFGKFSQTVWASKLAYVKENKLYKAIAGQKTPNGLELSGTWAEFCNMLGCSDEKANQDIANLKAFGEEALESMSRMGIGYREMRQFRKLPADQKEALISVAKEGDKESFLELAEDIFVKHSKEKEELSKQLANTQADYEAQGEVLNSKSMELTETRLELEKTRRRIQSMPANEAIKELRDEVQQATYEAEVPLMGKLREGFELLTKTGAETGTDHRAFMSAQVKQVELQLIALREEFGLSDEIGDAGELGWLEDMEPRSEEQFDFVSGEFSPTQQDVEA